MDVTEKPDIAQQIKDQQARIRDLMTRYRNTDQYGLLFGAGITLNGAKWRSTPDLAQEFIDQAKGEIDEAERLIVESERKSLEDERAALRQRVKALHEIAHDLIQVADWHCTLMRDIRSTAPEYLQRHPDPGAVAYLESEAQAILERARRVLEVQP